MLSIVILQKCKNILYVIYTFQLRSEGKSFPVTSLSHIIKYSLLNNT